MIRAAVVGATGYAGAELVRILTGHPDMELTAVTSRQYAGVRFDKVFPSMAGSVNLVCEEFSVRDIAEKTDAVFTALPHKLPMAFVPDLVKQGKKVVDLSADFRFGNVSQYEAFYQPHTAKDLLKEAVYGLSEVYADKIKTASVVGNPGCYPTSLLLPMIPLLKNKMLDIHSIIADSKSGVSGAGRSPSLTVHFCEAAESFKAYKVGNHRHTPEMEEVLSREAEESVSITFVPHLVPISRGMLTTAYATLARKISEADIRECIGEFYAGRPFIRLCQNNSVPDTRNVRGSNYCDIGFKIEARNNRLILISAIDNLVKGAAGQAVQNMNLMFGLDETRGLNSVPFPL